MFVQWENPNPSQNEFTFGNHSPSSTIINLPKLIFRTPNLGQQISTVLYDGIPVQTLGRRMPRSAVHVGTSPVVGLTSHDLA